MVRAAAAFVRARKDCETAVEKSERARRLAAAQPSLCCRVYAIWSEQVYNYTRMNPRRYLCN